MIACARWRSCYELGIGIVGPPLARVELPSDGRSAKRDASYGKWTSVQASWDQATIDCALFHYGGRIEGRQASQR